MYNCHLRRLQLFSPRTRRSIFPIEDGEESWQVRARILYLFTFLASGLSFGRAEWFNIFSFCEKKVIGERLQRYRENNIPVIFLLDIWKTYQTSTWHIKSSLIIFPYLLTHANILRKDMDTLGWSDRRCWIWHKVLINYKIANKSLSFFFMHQRTLTFFI